MERFNCTLSFKGIIVLFGGSKPSGTNTATDHTGCGVVAAVSLGRILKGRPVAPAVEVGDIQRHARQPCGRAHRPNPDSLVPEPGCGVSPALYPVWSLLGSE